MTPATDLAMATDRQTDGPGPSVAQLPSAFGTWNPKILCVFFVESGECGCGRIHCRPLLRAGLVEGHGVRPWPFRSYANAVPPQSHAQKARKAQKATETTIFICVRLRPTVGDCVYQPQRKP